MPLNAYSEKEMSAFERFERGSEFYAIKWYIKAVEEWKLAAELGSVSAKYSLGCCYQKNLGVEKFSDDQKRLRVAATWWVKAASEGDERAERALITLPEAIVGGVVHNGVAGMEKTASEQAAIEPFSTARLPRRRPHYSRPSAG